MTITKTFSSVILLATVFGTASTAQDLYSDMAGISQQDRQRGGSLIAAVSDSFQQGIENATEGNEFATQEQCLRKLQEVVNLGAIVSNVMPFSKVETLEDSRGPVGKLRVMLNGKQIHTEVYCADTTLMALELPWGAGDEVPQARESSSLITLLGLALNPQLRGIFQPDAAGVSPAEESLDLAVSNGLSSAPPMTGSEREGFRSSVNQCWKLEPGSDAARVQVTVLFNLDESGKIDGEVRQIASIGGVGDGEKVAFEAARDAIISCQGTEGYDLPIDKYDEWKEVEFTFDPSGLRMR